MTEIELHIGNRRTGILVAPDGQWHGMWRIKQKDGTLSDKLNLARAKDAALDWAEIRGRPFSWKVGQKLREQITSEKIVSCTETNLEPEKSLQDVSGGKREANCRVWGAISAERPWEDDGVSRATWYRKRAVTSANRPETNSTP